MSKQRQYDVVLTSCAYWVVSYAKSKDSDQTGQMPSLSVAQVSLLLFL